MCVFLFIRAECVAPTVPCSGHCSVQVRPVPAGRIHCPERCYPAGGHTWGRPDTNTNRLRLNSKPTCSSPSIRVYALAPPSCLLNGKLLSLRRVTWLCHRRSRDVNTSLLDNLQHFLFVISLITSVITDRAGGGLVIGVYADGNQHYISINWPFYVLYIYMSQKPPIKKPAKILILIIVSKHQCPVKVP